jgi:hypothetical protein
MKADKERIIAEIDKLGVNSTVLLLVILIKASLL